MKLEYDSAADAAYVKLNNAEVVDSDELRPEVIVDYDAQNRVVGIEILHVQKSRPDTHLGNLELNRV